MTTIGVVLGLLWLIAGLLIMIGVIPLENVDAYQLGSEKSAIWIQLMLYPFINYSAGSLMFNLVWLCGLVRVAGRHLKAAGFIRVYSLGTLGVGLMFWLLSKYLTGGQTNLSGSYLTLLTVGGAIAALAPNEILLPQRQQDGVPRSTILMVVFLVCIYLDFKLLFSRSNMSSFVVSGGSSSLEPAVMIANQQVSSRSIFALVPLVPTALMLYLTPYVRLKWWIVLLLLCDLWLIAWLKLVEKFLYVHVASRFLLVFILSEGVALAVGLLYGWTEKLYAKHESRLRMA